MKGLKRNVKLIVENFIDMKIQYHSIITFPNCGHQKEEEMPEDSCQFFYECEKCKAVNKTQKRRLLRLLFVWFGKMPFDTKE